VEWKRRTTRIDNDNKENATMKRILTVVLAGMLSAVPCGAFAAQAGGTKSQPPAKPAATKPAATHATAGVVKSVDDNSLVITRSGKNGGEMTLGLNAATQRKGTVAVGSSVSVRYRDEGTSHVATAITVQPMKHKSSGGK
jgi:hypothetical protein